MNVLKLIPVLFILSVVGCNKTDNKLESPTVTSTSPTNKVTGVARNAEIAFTFSEAMDPLTINYTTFTLKQGDTNVSGVVSYSGTTAKFTPAVQLASLTTYTATVTTGAKNLSGRGLANNAVWSFTTGGA